jgi:dCMP deaminase
MLPYLPYNDLVKEKHIPVILKHALDLAQLSTATRRKVGCVILKHNVEFTGYNGTHPNSDNTCEFPDGTTNEQVVIHAERNALFKLARAGFTPIGADVFVTCSPCVPCSLMLAEQGINSVFYIEQKRRHGLDILRKHGVHVIQVDIDFVIQ